MHKTTIFLIIATAVFLAIGVFSYTADVQTTFLVGADLLAGLMVLSFAFVQINLNRRLINLQDYVAVNMHPISEDRAVQFVNTGKINVYIYRIEIRETEADILIGGTEVFEKPRLLPAGTLENSFYYYPLPHDVYEHTDFKVRLLLIDELNRKWVSEHGGEILQDKNVVRTWSHKTQKEDWKIKKE